MHWSFFRISSSYAQLLDPTIDDDLEFIQDHPLHKGEPEAKGVLNELMVGSSESVRLFAEEGLARINKE
jgi:hypothetical protein